VDSVSLEDLVKFLRFSLPSGRCVVFTGIQSKIGGMDMSNIRSFRPGGQGKPAPTKHRACGRTEKHRVVDGSVVPGCSLARQAGIAGRAEPGMVNCNSDMYFFSSAEMWTHRRTSAQTGASNRKDTLTLTDTLRRIIPQGAAFAI
jgi:hypothetical protein